MRKGRFSEEQIINVLKEHRRVSGSWSCAASTGSATRRSKALCPENVSKSCAYLQ